MVVPHLGSGMLDPCIKASVLALNSLRHSRRQKGFGLRVPQRSILRLSQNGHLNLLRPPHRLSMNHHRSVLSSVLNILAASRNEMPAI